jgi:hypothetical protein
MSALDRPAFPDPPKSEHEIPEDGLLAPARKPDVVPEIPRPSEWPIRRLRDAFVDDEAPPWVIKNLVMAKTVTLVSAHPHAMKSLSWLYASLEAVVKGEVFGNFEAPGVKNTLFIETEDPEWLVKKRVQGFSKGLGIPESADVSGFHDISDSELSTSPARSRPTNLRRVR